MVGMFSSCKEFEQDISGWDTAEVTSMASMFFRCGDAQTFPHVECPLNLEEWVSIIIPLPPPLRPP